MSNPKTLTPKTANVTRVFRSATPEQIASAADWYADANRIAGVLADRYGVTINVAAGVIAALSPLNSWGANVNLAARFLATPGGLTSGYLSAGLAKARRILAGESPERVLTSNKVAAFYAGIISAGATDKVCIDRHAWSIAVNYRYPDGAIPKLTDKRYNEAQDAYRRAARILSREYGIDLSPAMTQSVTWVVWRARFWSEGAWDSHEIA